MSTKSSNARISATDAASALTLRPLEVDDLPLVVRLDAELTGLRKHAYWKRAFTTFVADDGAPSRVALAADAGGRLAGYLFGEVRAFEFGSEPCGWIVAVGVVPADAHRGVGSALVAEACRRFRAAGVVTVRTMVKREDLPMLSFFRANDFVGGPYVQLEHRAANER